MCMPNCGHHQACSLYFTNTSAVMDASYLLQVIKFSNIVHKQQTSSWPSTFSLSLDLFPLFMGVNRASHKQTSEIPHECTQTPKWNNLLIFKNMFCMNFRTGPTWNKFILPKKAGCLRIKTMTGLILEEFFPHLFAQLWKERNGNVTCIAKLNASLSFLAR